MKQKIPKILFLGVFLISVALTSLIFILPQKIAAVSADPTCGITLSGMVSGSNLQLSWTLATGYELQKDQSIQIDYKPASQSTWSTLFNVASPYKIAKPSEQTTYQAVVFNMIQDEDVCASAFVTFSPPDKISSASADPTEGAKKQTSGPTDSSKAATKPGEPAPNVSEIRNALTAGAGGNADWVIASWKVVLGLANMALVVVLAFLAAVNVLHIQYDTYAIKKILPILIIGVLLADFSLLIIRMLLDFSNIVTLLFTNNQTPADFAKNLIICANNAMSTGSSTSAATIGGLNCKPMDFGAASGQELGILFIWFLFSLLVMVAFFILGFMFYIRYVVIIVCAIAAPLAFIAMAFPPTQSFFKQWWGWLMKFIFMKPIAFFFLWIAFQVKQSEAMGSITGWMIMAFLIIAAVIVPFKLGGAVMGAWGKAGQWLTGTKAGGYIRKPIDNFIQSKKDAWKERANLAAEKYLRIGDYGLARNRQKHALTMERLKSERERVGNEEQVKLRAKLGPRLGMEKDKQARAKKDVEDIDMVNDILDREKRGEERTRNELRDRTIAAAHNAISKQWMYKIFEGGQGIPAGTPKIWAPIMTDKIAGGKGESYVGKSYAEMLGEIEGYSGEMDRGIEKVNSDAMLRVANNKLGIYYTQLAKAVITVGGEETSVEEAFHGVLKSLEDLEQKKVDLEAAGINRGEDYDALIEDINEQRRLGSAIVDEAKKITIKDADGNTVKDADGQEKKILDEEGVKIFEAAIRRRRTVAPEPQTGEDQAKFSK